MSLHHPPGLQRSSSPDYIALIFRISALKINRDSMSSISLQIKYFQARRPGGGKPLTKVGLVMKRWAFSASHIDPRQDIFFLNEVIKASLSPGPWRSREGWRSDEGCSPGRTTASHPARSPLPLSPASPGWVTNEFSRKTADLVLIPKKAT